MPCEPSLKTDEQKKITWTYRRAKDVGLTLPKSILDRVTPTKSRACLILMMLLSISGVSLAQLEGTASWYSTECCRYNPDPNCPMANGESLYEAEKEEKNFAAMWGVPLGAEVKVTNIKSGSHTRVTVLDRGPNRRFKDRVIDLSKKAFQEIADISEGLIAVKVEVLQ